MGEGTLIEKAYPMENTGVESVVTGVFSSNKLPVVNMYPSTLIANIDPHDQTSAHWIAVYLNNKTSL